ncbi:replication fork protection component Swi3-domain-containing protein [Lentinula raphanica]|nr:replication fork protection component Swi3-domain-containing protein [Lentinula raphanica]
MDIFDDDNDLEIVSRPSTSTSAASHASSSSSQPLFLPDQDEEDNLDGGHGIENQEGPPAQPEVNVDDIFDSVVGDDLNFDYVPLARKEIDYDSLQREAQRKAKAKVPRHEILSSSPPPPDNDDTDAKKKKGRNKDDGEKEKRRPMRLDEARLVGPTGFPQLIEDTKHFKIKGKGHEATDLNRLLQIYQYWTHRMYPKSQFKDTVDRVEKLCHTKLMHNKLSMWRDEAHGKTHEDSEEEDVAENDADDVSIPNDTNPEETASDAAAYASSSSPPTRPPSSAPSNARDEFDDQDMEQIWEEMEREQAAAAANNATPSSAIANGGTGSSKGGEFMDVDDDIEGWLAFEETMDTGRSANSTNTPTAPTKSINSGIGVTENNDDEEMWELSDQMAQKQKDTVTKKTSTTEENFDDIYC